MYGGQIVEIAGVQEIFRDPRHPYTQGLLKAMPKMDEDCEQLYNIKGSVPAFANMPKGCPFSTRCAYASEQCFEMAPAEREVSKGHSVRCWRVSDAKEREG